MRNIFAQFKCTKYSESEEIVDDTMSQSASIDEFGGGELPPNHQIYQKVLWISLKVCFKAFDNSLSFKVGS